MTQIIHDSGAIMHTYKFSSNLLPVYKIIGWYGADDILITARTQQTLIDTFGKLKDISSQYGLIVNESKTKYMKCTRRENTLGKLRAGDIQIDQVKSCIICVYVYTQIRIYIIGLPNIIVYSSTNIFVCQ